MCCTQASSMPSLRSALSSSGVLPANWRSRVLLTSVDDAIADSEASALSGSATSRPSRPSTPRGGPFWRAVSAMGDSLIAETSPIGDEKPERRAQGARAWGADDSAEDDDTIGNSASTKGVCV